MHFKFLNFLDSLNFFYKNWETIQIFNNFFNFLGPFLNYWKTVENFQILENSIKFWNHFEKLKNSGTCKNILEVFGPFCIEFALQKYSVTIAKHFKHSWNRWNIIQKEIFRMFWKNSKFLLHSRKFSVLKLSFKTLRKVLENFQILENKNAHFEKSWNTLKQSRNKIW